MGTAYQGVGRSVRTVKRAVWRRAGCEPGFPGRPGGAGPGRASRWVPTAVLRRWARASHPAAARSSRVPPGSGGAGRESPVPAASPVMSRGFAELHPVPTKFASRQGQPRRSLEGACGRRESWHRRIPRSSRPRPLRGRAAGRAAGKSCQRPFGSDATTKRGPSPQGRIAARRQPPGGRWRMVGGAQGARRGSGRAG